MFSIPRSSTKGLEDIKYYSCPKIWGSILGYYRPISQFSLVSKVRERLIHSKPLNYILSNDLLSNCQHGFIPGSSTQEALLLATNEFIEFQQTSCCSIFYNIQKAFVSLPHHLLINSPRLWCIWSSANIVYELLIQQEAASGSGW